MKKETNTRFMKHLLAILSLLGIFTNPAEAEETAVVLAGGCFWCIESDFEKLDGVLSVASGYSGGQSANPTYKQVSRGNGHIEVVKVVYDPSKQTHKSILNYFVRHIDPTDSGGQFCDRGPQYRPAIFYANEAEKQTAEEVMKETEKEINQRTAVDLLPAAPFYPAEDYHQDYAKKNPLRYKFYRFNCGRDARIKKVWNK